MVKLSVMYPLRDGAKFDLDYYVSRHIPLLQQLWGDLMEGTEVLRGLEGSAPDEPPT